MVQYKIDETKRDCLLKVFTRIRPGFIEKLMTNIKIETFNIDKELQHMKLEI